MSTDTAFESVHHTDLEEGDLVRCDPSRLHSMTRDCIHSDGKVYGRVKRPTPDSDHEIYVAMIDPDNGDLTTGTYFHASSLESVPDWWDVRQGGDEDLEAHLASRDESESLAVLEEEQKNLVQMQELKARTVRPGVLHLPVTMVTSAENSEQWAIVVDHPVCGEMRFYREKPLGGWSDDYDIVGLLDSYGIADGNPYKLQCREVYVELVGDDASSERSWRLRRRDEIVDGQSSSGGDDESRSLGQRIIDCFRITGVDA